MLHVDPVTLSPACPYCGGWSELVALRDAPGASATHVEAAARVWSCGPCEAYVGCHDGSPLPLGVPARRPLRRWRQVLHDVIDPIWHGAPAHPEFAEGVRRDPMARAIARKKVRRRVYDFLGDVLDLGAEENHVAMYDEGTCAAAAAAVSAHGYEGIAAWAGPLEDARTALPGVARENELTLARARAEPPRCPGCLGAATLVEVDQDKDLHEVPYFGWACEPCGLEADCFATSSLPVGPLGPGAARRARRLLRAAVRDVSEAAPRNPHYAESDKTDLVRRRIVQVARMRIEDWLRVVGVGEPSPVAAWDAATLDVARARLADVGYDDVRAWAAAVGWNSRRRLGGVGLLGAAS